MNRRLIAVLAVLGAAVSVSFAQDKAPTAPAAPAAPATPAAPAAGLQPVAAPKPEVTLKAGMPAPEFKVEKFIKGEPFTSLEKGRVYVIEFWATWCQPCVMGIPHLTELQKEYKEKGVVICGVNIAEEKVYTEETLKKVTKFVESTGDAMGYTVAFDGGVPWMQTAWMKAAGRSGIPCAFVVDQKGTIAWIGHPMQLSMVLDEVTTGKWDIEKGPEQLKVAQEAFNAAFKKYEEGYAAGNTAWDETAKQYPAMSKSMERAKFRVIVQAKLIPEACVLGNEMIEKAKKAKTVGPITEVLDAFSDPEALKTAPAKELLLKAAQANFELSDATTFQPHVIMARAYFFSGDMEKGRASAAKAVELAPADIRERLGTWLKSMEEEATAK